MYIKNIFLFSIVCFASLQASVDAGEYYLSRQDFKQALELYSHAEDPRSILRITDLKFLLQGRTAARESLLSFLEKNKNISLELRAQATEKLDTLLETFVTDEGQSEYYRAQTKIRHGDWNSAESLLESSATREDGNILVLNWKAQCEKELKKYNEYSATLAQISEQNPFSAKAAEKLAEAYFAEKEFSKVLALFIKNPPEKMSYNRLLFLMSQSELSKNPDLDELEDFTEQYPIALFYFAKELLKTEEDKAEALKVFAQFQSKYPVLPIENWEPYKLAEKIAETKKILGN